jgi:hypothetical protein
MVPDEPSISPAEIPAEPTKQTAKQSKKRKEQAQKPEITKEPAAPKDVEKPKKVTKRVSKAKSKPAAFPEEIDEILDDDIVSRLFGHNCQTVVDFLFMFCALQNLFDKDLFHNLPSPNIPPRHRNSFEAFHAHDPLFSTDFGTIERHHGHHGGDFMSPGNFHAQFMSPERFRSSSGLASASKYCTS